METLAEALPKQIARNLKLIQQYESIGPVGMFAKQMIAQDIESANKAIMSGDVVEMLRIYKVLEENE